MTDRPEPQLDEREPSNTPVFLVGPARSGTSLLYKALCLHPEAAYVSNWVARFPKFPRLAAANRLARALPKTRRRVWFGRDSNAYVYGRRRSLRHRLFPMPVEGEPVYASCGIPQDMELQAEGMWEQGQALRRAFSSIRNASGGSVLINKRIANNLRLAFLAATYPQARFVSLVRDGRAVALSLSKVDWWPESNPWWYGGTPQDWAAQGGDPWELCARNWVEELDVVERGLDLIPPEQVLRLSYESFVDDPRSTLGRIAGFAGLPDNEGWRTAISALRFPDRNEAWRVTLNAGTVKTITQIQAEQLEAHGYDV